MKVLLDECVNRQFARVPIDRFLEGFPSVSREHFILFFDQAKN